MNYMLELFCNILDGLNKFAGLFSLLAVIVAAFVPYKIYKKQQEDKHLDDLDELDAMNDVSRFPMTSAEREYFVKKSKLEKRIKRK